jgi:translation initiation factor 4G
VQGDDPEEAKRQKEIKGHLDKITPENYERIRDQIIAIDFSNLSTLRGLVEQVVDKALGEPAFCEICAQLCFDLLQKLPELPAIPPNEETGDFGREKVTFRRELLNKVQIEFEEGAAATFAVARREKAKAEVPALHSVGDGRCGCSYLF